MSAMIQCYECKKFYKGKQAIRDHKRNTGHAIEGDNYAALDDSNKLQAKIAELEDSLNDKDEFIAELEESLQRRNIDFVKLNKSFKSKENELVTLNNTTNSNDYKLALLRDFFNSPEFTREIYDETATKFQQLGEMLGFREPIQLQPVIVAPVETKETTTAPVVDSKPVEEPSIVFHEVKDDGWTWYPALGYSIKK